MINVHNSSKKQPNICERKKTIQVFHYKGMTLFLKVLELKIVRDTESVWESSPPSSPCS